VGVVDHIGTHRAQQQAREAAEAPASDHEKIDFVGQVDKPPARMTVVRHPLDPGKRAIQSGGHGVNDLANEAVGFGPNQLKLRDRHEIRSRASRELPYIDRADFVTLRGVLDRPPQREARPIRTIHPDRDLRHHRIIADEQPLRSRLGPGLLSRSVSDRGELLPRRRRLEHRGLSDPGLGLFFGLPPFGSTGVETRTAVFLYESLAQLAFVYPSRLILARPARNRILNWIVAISLLVQFATLAVPGLRTVLGLETLDTTAYGLFAGALAVSVLGATISARLTSKKV